MIYWHIAPFAAANQERQRGSPRWHDPVVTQCEGMSGAGTSRHFAAMHHFGRFRSEADIEPDLGVHGLALLWQILSGRGFPNQFFNDSWVVGFWRADHGWQDVGLERRAWTLAQA